MPDLDITIPAIPVALTGPAWARLAELTAERAKIGADMAAASRDAQAMDRELATARRADQAAYAAAIRAGKADPGRKAEAAALARAEDLARRRKGARSARQSVDADVLALVEAEAEAMATEVAAALDGAVAELHAAVEAAQAAGEAILALQTVAAWLSEPEGKLRRGQQLAALDALSDAARAIAAMRTPPRRDPTPRRHPSIRLVGAGRG